MTAVESLADRPHAVPSKAPDDRVYVLLVNWKSWGDTLECLESLFRQDYDNFQVVVCDNDSGDGSLEHIAAWAEGRLDAVVPAHSPMRRFSHPPVPKPIPYRLYDRASAESGGVQDDATVPLVLVETGGNLGFAGGSNVGIRYAMARGDFAFAWLLNNDTVIEPHALSALVERMKQDRDIGQCGSTVLFYHKPDVIQCQAGGTFSKLLCRTQGLSEFSPLADRLPADAVERRLAYVFGASLCVSKSFLERVGPLGEDYFLYYEEIDWSLRSQGRFKLAYAPDSNVYHKSGASSGRDIERNRISQFADRYYLRNRLIVTRRYLRWALPIVYLTYLGAIINRMRRGQWDRVGMVIQVLLKASR